MAASHKHHSGLDSNDTGSRIKHATRSSYKHTIPAKRVFGTPDEIQHRVGGTLSSLPDDHPSNFRQVGPDSTGGDFENKKPAERRGDSKFGNPRHYA